MATLAPTVAVIVAAHNASATLDTCLRAIAASTVSLTEILVADDASTDTTARSASAHGATVLRLPGARPAGPAAARNVAAGACTADILVFLDADVAVHPGAVERLLLEIARDDDVAASFGSYDDAPPAPSVAASYANLRHHYVHQHANRAASTFWAGCGAMRRTDFERVGGFDAARFPRPSIEDIHLGLRLTQAGRRIRCVPEAQGTHLKAWTVRQVWRTDILHRALPWSRLMVQERHFPNDLNGTWRERVAAVLAHLIWVGAVSGLVLGSAGCAVAAGVSLLAWLWLNRSFLGLLRARRGWRVAVGAAALHWAYHLYSSVILGSVTAAHLLGTLRPGRTSRSAARRPLAS